MKRKKAGIKGFTGHKLNPWTRPLTYADYFAAQGLVTTPSMLKEHAKERRFWSDLEEAVDGKEFEEK